MNSVRQIDVVCAAGLLALTLACSAVAFKLANHHRSSVNHHNDTVTNLRQEMQSARAHIRKLQHARGIALQYLHARDERILTAADVGSFLDRLEQIAAEQGVDLTDLRQQPVFQMEKSVGIPLIVACRGGFEQIHGFLYELENAGPMVKMDKLNLTADRAAGECALSLRASIIQN